MRACWLKWVGRDWSISADYIWLNYSGANSRLSDQVLNSIIEAEAGQLHCSGVNSRNIYCECILKTCSVDIVVALYYEVTQVVTGN